jgi:flagellar biosynthesis protein FlhG
MTFRPPSLPNDQADGLRRLFAGSRVRFVAVASNPHVAFGGVLLERLCAACTELGRKVLVVDAADTSPAFKDLAVLDLAACVEPLSAHVAYLAARGLPLRHVDARGTTGAFLDAVADAVPDVDVVLVHAGASDLGRLFARRAPRPLLLAGDNPTSVTHAYASMKLLVQRNALRSFDLLLAASGASPRRERIAAQLAGCADNFLNAVLHGWASVDPACHPADAPPRALTQLVRELLDCADDALPPAAWPAETAASTRLPGAF